MFTTSKDLISCAIIFSRFSSVISKPPRTIFSLFLSDKFLTIPFEKFVVNPNPYLKKINSIMNTEFSRKTKKILKKQKIPRKKIADGINLDIYKRYLWEPSNQSLSENEELNLRRNWVKEQGANKYSMDVLDEVSNYYEKEFLDN